MKQFKKSDGKVVMYGYRDEELHRNLRKLGHKIVEDKKKKSSKNACRGKHSVI